MPALLTIDDLHISYGAREVLKGISIRLDEGEIVTVLGANGAGKSTLLQAVCGLIPIAGGRVTYAGAVLNKVPAYDIVVKGISLSPEGRRVFPTHSVEENLNLGAFTRRKHADEIVRAKERVHSLFPILKERSRQLAGTLSGGEQQMLAIGRALMSNPRVLLLDEPSLGLAPILVKQIFEIIREINAQGTSILLVEQNAHKSLNIASRGYVLENGRIAAEGPAAMLKSDEKIQEAYLGGTALKKKKE
ncbi:MAG TPA: ABC transporter ATP-binding protein [Deltaproteobacteria bacterium]|nr:ABC transporter ATP-binding protein [Deltaproteobacteria bacterium]HPR54290.1 ABC transporter ATP-binding protein [Deltaproteobacteria bacterium]HXK45798.1 ABC transporter ATP-binding protein [Deltaproteobacteria bacterium]